MSKCNNQIYVPTSGCNSCKAILDRIRTLEDDVLTLKNSTDSHADIIAALAEDIAELKTCCQQVQSALANIYTKAEIDAIVEEILCGGPVFLGVAPVTIEVGDTFDPMDGVTAMDGVGNDITEDVVVTGTVDTQTAGEYTLTYSVTDSHGHSGSVTRVVTVETPT